MNCSYCGREIAGEGFYPGGVSETIAFDGDTETVVEPARKVIFCSHACAWRWWLREEKSLGMTGKEARRHLIDVHGLTPPNC